MSPFELAMPSSLHSGLHLCFLLLTQRRSFFFSNTCVGVNDLKNSDNSTDGKTKQAIIPGKKKAQAKSNKKLPQVDTSDLNCEDLESDSGVSIEEGSTKGSCSNSASSRKKRFSKTAKLVGQVEQGEEFGDLVAAEKNEGKSVEHKAKTKLRAVKKTQNSKQEKVAIGKELVNREKDVTQGKPVSQERPVSLEKAVNQEKLASQGNGHGEEGEKLSDDDKGKTKRNKNSVEKVNGGQQDAEVSEEDENETCTEEEEQQCEERENRAVTKQRTKLVKKVKVSKKKKTNVFKQEYIFT